MSTKNGNPQPALPLALFIDRFPVEIKIEILSWLPEEDIASLRLASREIASIPVLDSWQSRMGAPEYATVDYESVQKWTCEYENQGGAPLSASAVLKEISRGNNNRTRIINMAKQAYWMTSAAEVLQPWTGLGRSIPKSIRAATTEAEEKGDEIDVLRERGMSGPESLLAIETNLKTLAWKSGVVFSQKASFTSVKATTFYFNSVKRFSVLRSDKIYQRFLTGIKFDCPDVTQRLGYCQGSAWTVNIPDAHHLFSMSLGLDKHSCVRKATVILTDGQEQTKHRFQQKKAKGNSRIRYSTVDFEGIEVSGFEIVMTHVSFREWRLAAC